MRLSTVGVVAVMGLLAPRAIHAQDDMAAVRRVIDVQNQAWAEATRAGDAAAIARIFADSGVELSLRAGKTWKGRAAIQELFTQMYQNPHATEAVVQTDQVIFDGPTAIEYGHYRFTYPSKDGQPQVDSGHYVVVWRKQADGTWRILLDTGLPPA
ncbi:MAG TPA: SgcJ/EcaC family oxidoreductase [Gemmatimonadales bacterium]